MPGPILVYYFSNPQAFLAHVQSYQIPGSKFSWSQCLKQYLGKKPTLIFMALKTYYKEHLIKSVTSLNSILLLWGNKQFRYIFRYISCSKICLHKREINLKHAWGILRFLSWSGSGQSVKKKKKDTIQEQLGNLFRPVENLIWYVWNVHIYI